MSLPAFQLLLEAGRPAFQLSMFAKGDAQPKGDVLYMFVSEIHSRHSSWNSKPTLPTRSLSFLRGVRSAISALNHGCIMPFPSLQMQKKIVL